MNVEERLEEQKKENIELKAKVAVLETTIASLGEKHQNEIAELKVFFEEKLKKLEEMIHTNKQKTDETESEVMVPIRQMKVLLPLENWHDLLAFVPRIQLGNVVSKIGHRQFAYIIQSFLHDELRKIKFGRMEIIAPRPYVSSDQPMLHVWPNATNIPDSSMPGNIKDFKEIVLNYMDASVLHFFKKFQENSLLTDVNICFACDLSILAGNGRLLLTKIAPFITSIDSVDSIESLKIDLFDMLNNNTNHELLFKGMMAQTRILAIKWYYGTDPWEEYQRENKITWFCSWLYTPRKDGKPRMLRFINDSRNFVSFIERIKKDFNLAKHAVSFFIYVTDLQHNVENISIENDKTKEKLVIKQTQDQVWGDLEKTLVISRYPVNAAKNWIVANEEEITWWHGDSLNRHITLTNDLTQAIWFYDSYE